MKRITTLLCKSMPFFEPWDQRKAQVMARMPTLSRYFPMSYFFVLPGKVKACAEKRSPKQKGELASRANSPFVSY